MGDYDYLNPKMPPGPFYDADADSDDVAVSVDPGNSVTNATPAPSITTQMQFPDGATRAVTHYPEMPHPLGGSGPAIMIHATPVFAPPQQGGFFASNTGSGQIVTGQNAQAVSGVRSVPTFGANAISDLSNQASANFSQTGSEPAQSSIPGQHFIPAGKPMSVDSVSLSGGFGAGPFFGFSPSVQGSAGLAIDDQGNVALIGTGGGSLTGARGAGLSGGVNISTSNAGSVNNLKGVFDEESAGGGDGPAAYGTAFQGKDDAGNKINGYGVTLGVGAGGFYNRGKSYTVVVPLAGYGKSK